MNKLNIIEAGQTLDIPTANGRLVIRSGHNDCFVTLWLDCDKIESSNLVGMVKACERSLNYVIGAGGFGVLDYGLGAFKLCGYDNAVTLPAILLWFHGRDYSEETKRLRQLHYNNTQSLSLVDGHTI